MSSTLLSSLFSAARSRMCLPSTYLVESLRGRASSGSSLECWVAAGRYLQAWPPRQALRSPCAKHWLALCTQGRVTTG